MFWQLKHRFQTEVFNFKCRGILSSPPISVPFDSGPLVVSMLCHKDVCMYLIAAKSLLRNLQCGRVAILNDGSLTKTDIRLLEKHLNPFEIAHIRDVDTQDCPRGVCFERLFYVASLVESNFVIELDSDTLTRDSVPEVLGCIESNTSFVLGVDASPLGSSILPMPKAWEITRNNGFRHPQTDTERNLNQLESFETLQYVRGSAALVGFGKSSFTKEAIRSWSRQIEEIIGPEAWHVWGADQVVVNMIIANMRNSIVLPYPKYMCHPKDTNLQSTVFFHFHSPYRFESKIYSLLARRLVDKLRQG
jgi:hypothetical protein